MREAYVSLSFSRYCANESSHIHSANRNVDRLILGCRSIGKGNEAREMIIKETKCRKSCVDIWDVDLSSYASVVAFANRVKNELPRLDAIIANAGLELLSFQEAEGLEMTLTVNVVSTMLLNILVLPKLRETSAKHGKPTYVTSVGSSLHIFGATAELTAPPQDKSIDTFARLSNPSTADMGGPDAQSSPRYALSKTILHAVMSHFAAAASRAKYNEQVIVNWVNPGWCASGLARDRPATTRGTRIAFAIMGRTAEQGSRGLVHAVVAGKESHNHYLSECKIKNDSSFLRSEQGEAVRARLWKELIARLEKVAPEVSDIVA